MLFDNVKKETEAESPQFFTFEMQVVPSSLIVLGLDYISAKAFDTCT